MPTYPPDPMGSSNDFRRGGQQRALVLDGCGASRQRLLRLVAQTGLNISFTEASDLEGFASALEMRPYDTALIGEPLPDDQGLTALRLFMNHPLQHNARAILIAQRRCFQTAIEAMKAGCEDVLLGGDLSEDVLAKVLAPTPTGVRQVHRNSVPAVFAEDHAVDLRAILVSMFEQVRQLRRADTVGGHIAGIEATCAQLWNFLEAIKSTEAALSHSQRRLN